ncbi:hypothetical protein [Pseudomonas sp. LW8]|uniref:hypothetical protein n=1 Tax=Pseudomonas sp. LW8 TaxID=3242677 RepID=UPI0035C203A0
MWWKISLIVLVLMAFFFVAGLYVGGVFFLLVTGQAIDAVTWHTLIDVSSMTLNDRGTMYLPWAWCATIALTFFPLALTLLALFSRKPTSNLHGNARFANNAELRIFEYKGPYQ